MKNRKIDHRTPHFMILDCETATFPFVTNYEPAAKKKISIARPLIYDIGWIICDRRGYPSRHRSFLVAEIFGNPDLFQTAYYADKRPRYLEKLKSGIEIELKPWNEIAEILMEDLQEVNGVCAYNAAFDFKKAIPITDRYIEKVYSPDYSEWIAEQHRICDSIAAGEKIKSNRRRDDMAFKFRGNTYPMFDLWRLACEHLLNCEWYKEKCAANGWWTNSGKYYKSSAETSYAFISGNPNFVEDHTAYEDAKIEMEIFREICRRTRNKIEPGLVVFPFKILGRADK